MSILAKIQRIFILALLLVIAFFVIDRARIDKANAMQEEIYQRITTINFADAYEIENQHSVNRVEIIAANRPADWSPKRSNTSQIGYPDVINHINKINDSYKAEQQRIMLEKWRSK